MKYAVLLRAEKDYDLKNLAEVISRRRKVPMLDTMPVAKKCWGIVEEGLEKDEADAFAAALGEARLDAFSLPGESIAVLPEMLQVKSLEFTAEGLRSECVPYVRVDIPLDKVVLIAAAIIPHTTVREVVTERQASTGDKLKKLAINAAIPGASIVLDAVKGKQRQVNRTGEADHLLFLDLFLEPPAKRLRIDGNRLKYAFLGEKMTPAMLMNFNLMVRGLAKMAPSALHSKGARVILGGRAVREMGYASVDDLERESRCILSVHLRDCRKGIEQLGENPENPG